MVESVFWDFRLMWWSLLFLAACLRGIFTIWHAWLVHSFVHSKPPGRKIVWKTHVLESLLILPFAGNNRYQCLCAYFCCPSYHIKLYWGSLTRFGWTSSISGSFWVQPDLQTLHLLLHWSSQCFIISSICYHHKSKVRTWKWFMV